ncbi:hypothetical protein SEUCBS140593_004075 [Sporothrix eucalyptigena]|uniref:Zn(2)-C6 fungal-type domain-containing protein n=1 Tax=Sporothrix eucalyptigena TaxID=1812306 RepID=A0ABP0BK14_9PEZI
MDLSMQQQPQQQQQYSDSSVVAQGTTPAVGCLTCRARKVKCDEARPVCNKCHNLDVVCEWQNSSQATTAAEGTGTVLAAAPTENASVTSPAASAASPRRRVGGRPTPACYTCRYARSRCSMTLPSCARCQLYGHQCSYPEPRSNRTLTPSAQQWMQRRQSEVGTTRTGTEDGAPKSVTTSPEGHPQPQQSHEYEDDLLPPPDTQQTTLPLAPPPPPQAPQQQASAHASSPQRSHSLASDRPSLSSRAERPLHVLSTQSPATSRASNDILPAPLPPPANPPPAQHTYSPSSPTSSSTRYRLPSQERIERLAVAFFQCVHVYRSNAFLHRDRALMAIRDETISPAILLAICAVGARFTSPPEPEDVARAWADDAGHRVMSVGECSRETVAVSLLLNIYSQQAMRFSQAHSWGAVAMNQAITLGLHREVPPSSIKGTPPTFDEAEGDRRLFLACYTINRFASNGQPAAVSCPTSLIKLRLPCDGFNYRLDVSVETPYAILEDDETHVPAWMYKNVGAMGMWVRLVGARFMVKKSFQAMVTAQEEAAQTAQERLHEEQQGAPTPTSSSSSSMPWHPGSLFAASITKLASIRESLPPRQRLHSGLLHRKRNTTGLSQIVMFYLWWNECHLELCSVVLPGYPQSLDPDTLATAPAGWVDHTRQNCLRYAQAITDIVVLVEQETKDHPLIVYDHTVAHAVYLAIRVQLEILGPPSDNTSDQNQQLPSRKRFEMALQLVERTAVYFHSISLLVKEMRRMLAEYFDGPPTNEPGDDNNNESPSLPRRPETPPLPWFRRLKDIEAERAAQRLAQRNNHQNPDRLETVLLELLPDYSSYGLLGGWSNTQAYDGDEFYSQVGLQGAWGQPTAIQTDIGAMPANFHHPTQAHPFADPTGPASLVDYSLDDDLLPNVVALPPAVSGPFFLPSGGYQ